MTAETTPLPTVVIGTGPVGMAAAAQLADRGLPFVVLEAGAGPGSSVREWGHVRIFSRWELNIDDVAGRLLEKAGWTAPDGAGLPTGAELVDHYLAPLGAVPQLAPHVRYGARVVGLARDGIDKVRSQAREERPFVARLADGEEIRARAVIDASGTWRTPNVLGADGLPARGEADAVTAGRVVGGLPDVLGAERALFAGQHTVVVGAGHSAATTLFALVDLAGRVPGTRVTWALRADTADRAYGGGTADELTARGALGAGLRTLVGSGSVGVVTGFRVREVRATDVGVVLTGRGLDGPERILTADRVVNATGFRPDHSIATELRLDLDPVLDSTRQLAPLIDPNVHSCGTVPPHGVDELSHPEPNYWAVGMKSYGRAPTFLMTTGYEQVRSIVAALDGDRAAARRVQLTLPEAGGCGVDARAGGLLTLTAGSSGGGCCGA